MKSYKGWEIRVSADIGFFSSGRGGKTVKSYSAYKDRNSMFAPSLGAKTLAELKKKIDQHEKREKERGFLDVDFF